MREIVYENEDGHLERVTVDQVTYDGDSGCLTFAVDGQRFRYVPESLVKKISASSRPHQ